MAIEKHTAGYRILQLQSSKKGVKPCLQKELASLEPLFHTTHHAAIALDDNDIIIKKISVSEALTHPQIQQQIYRSESIDHRWSLDYDVLGMNPNDPSQIDLNIAYARRTLIASHCAPLHRVKLCVTQIRLKSDALSNASDQKDKWQLCWGLARMSLQYVD